MSVIAKDLFNVDEMIYLNSASTGVLQSELTRERILQNLGFAMNITEDDNVMVRDLLSGLIATVSNIKDDVWDTVKAALPFPVAYEDGSKPPAEESV
jgi:hypothetical protein